MVNIRTVKKDEVQKLQDLNDQVIVDNSKYDPDIKIDWAQSSIGQKYFTEVLNNPDAICLIAEDGDIPLVTLLQPRNKWTTDLVNTLKLKTWVFLRIIVQKGLVLN